MRRNFTAERSDSVWCGDLTEIPTGEGQLYLATVLDLFSRRLLGYAMSDHHDATLAAASLQMAAAARGGDVAGVIFHSDRGSEYTAADYAGVRGLDGSDDVVRAGVLEEVSSRAGS